MGLINLFFMNIVDEQYFQNTPVLLSPDNPLVSAYLHRMFIS